MELLGIPSNRCTSTNLLSKFKGSDIAAASYPTIRHYLKAHGMFRKAAPKRATAGALAARERLEQLEVQL